MARCSIVLALCGLLFNTALGAQNHVLLVDSSSNSYLLGQESKQPVKITKPQFEGVVAGLTGLQPAVELDAQASSSISSIVKSSALKKPKAHVSINLAGLSQEDVESLFSDKNTVSADLSTDQHVAEAMIRVLTALSSANPDVDILSVDGASTLDCHDADCLQQYLQLLHGAIGASITSDSLTLPNGVQLNLDQAVNRVFAAELAGMIAGVQEQTAALQQAPAQDIHVMEMTMLGLQGLTSNSASSSDLQQQQQVTAGAKQAVKQLLQWAVRGLDDVFKGDVTYQVTTFDEAPTEAVVGARHQLRQLMLRRRLQQEEVPSVIATNNGTWPPADQVAAAKTFSAKAAGYGAFVLLLYFSFAGVYFMCFMPFKKDSLLYGSKKTE